MEKRADSAHPAASVVLALLAAVLVLPSLVWCLVDRSVWWWDQAFYGDGSVRTWVMLRLGAGAWLSAMIHALAGAPPLIVWVGHLLVPLRRLTGQFESALLLTNIVADVIVLWLVNAVTRELGARPLERAAAILCCGGSGIFIAPCHQFLVETVTGAAAAFAIYVALRSDRVSVLRGAALLVLAVSVGLLAKASSGIFLAPLAGYVVLAWWLARGRPRPPATRADVALAAFACLLALGTVSWYAVNWPYMVEHFLNSTVAEKVVLFYGSPVVLSKKIPFWIGALSRSISSFAWLSAALAGLIIAVLAVALYRTRRRPWRQRIKSAWEDGTLLVLTLGFSVIGTIIVFSLQANEDTRFLITTTPMIAVLVGWSLKVLSPKVLSPKGPRVPLLSAAVILLLAGNAAVNHALGFGRNPLYVVPYNYFQAPDLDGVSRSYLDAAIGVTCPREATNRWNVIAVSYPHLNSNTANFTSQKLMIGEPWRCRYGDPGFAQTDLAAGLDRIIGLNPLYIVTLDAARQPVPDFANRISKPITEWLAQYPRYEEVLRLPNGYIVYRERAPTAP
jgi:hypothetical protein